MSAVVANAPGAALLSAKDIDVMHFLFEHPTSTEKLILDGVCVIDDANELSLVLDSLKSKGLTRVHLDSLYALTELGEVVIGKREANTFLASEVIRRRLPQSGCARAYTYRWGDKAGRPAPTLQVVPSDVDNALDAWCLTEEEYAHLCEDTPIRQPSALTNRLLARELFAKSNGVITRTPLGQQLVDDPSLASPANTHWLGLTRHERLLVEMMAKRHDLFAHQSSMFELLSMHGFTGTKKNLKAILDGLLEKNILLYRTNKAYYLRYPLLMVMGLRKYVPGDEAEILALPNGAFVLARMEAGATNALTSSLKQVHRGPRASKPNTQALPGQKTQLPLLDTAASSASTTQASVALDTVDVAALPSDAEQGVAAQDMVHVDTHIDVGVVADEVEDAVSTFPTAEESAVMNELMPEASADEQDAWYQSAMSALSGFEVREPMLPAPKIKGAGTKAAFLTKLASMFDAEKGKDVRVMLEFIAKDLREISAWQSAQKKRG